MSNNWRRSSRNELWKDLQALAIWILIIGVAGYILFPNFFKEVFTRLYEPVTQTDTTDDEYTLNTTSDSTTQALIGEDYTNVTNALYNSGVKEIASGYWVIYVADGEFKQLSVSTDSYTFLVTLIGNDNNTTGKNSVIMVENGQIRQFVVSDELYAIINNMALIVGRSSA